MIYFAHAPAVNALKIGRAKDVEKRLRDIQAMCPVEVRLVRTLDLPVQAEWWLHARYDHLRLYGEWFRFVDEMLAVEVPSVLPKVKRLESPYSVLRREEPIGDYGVPL